MNKRGGGGTRTPRPRPPTDYDPDSLFGRLDINNPASPFYQIPDFLPNGPGFGVTPAGSYTSSSGAIYATPDSNWFLHVPGTTPPDFGSYSGEGVGPYAQEFSLTPAQAAWLYEKNTGMGTQLYNLIVNGVQPGAVGTQQHFGAPGTLIYDPFNPTLGKETWADHPGAAFYGDPSDFKAGSINPKFLNQKKPKKKKKTANWLNPTGY